MRASTVNPDNQSPTVHSHSGIPPRPQVPLRKKWPRFKEKVKDTVPKEETMRRFGYEPHGWQLQAALKVPEANDGVVVAGIGKGKTMIFALLGLAVSLTGPSGLVMASVLHTFDNVKGLGMEAAVLMSQSGRDQVLGLTFPEQLAHTHLPQSLQW